MVGQQLCLCMIAVKLCLRNKELQNLPDTDMSPWLSDAETSFA